MTAERATSNGTPAPEPVAPLSAPPRPHGDPLREVVPDDADALAAGEGQEEDRHERGEPQRERREARPQGEPLRADRRAHVRAPDTRDPER